MQKSGGIIGPNDKSRDTQASPRDQQRRSPRFSMAIGSRPLDGYTIKRGIGAGGFGEVYYAKSDGGKDVAIKRIQRNLDVELRGVRQCLNIKHPNLLSLYDIKYDDQDQAWVLMEYVAGESLQGVIERNPNGMPNEAIQKWFDGITAGTAHLHDCGIVHRDLKPANIFIDEAAVKIGDYGLSKFISCSRRSGQTQSVGTFHYMAPEIGNGRYGREIDIYALGIILYEMLTGRVPFDGESSQEIIMKHLTAKPAMELVAAPYRSTVAKALAKDPQERFSTVDEMRQSLAKHAGWNTTSSSKATAPDVDAQAASVAASVEAMRNAAATGVGARTRAEARKLAASKFAGNVAGNVNLPDEPIARAAIAASKELQRGWQEANMGAAPKFFLLVGAFILAAMNARWLIPYVIVLSLCYAAYLGIRSMAIASHRRKQQRIEAALVRQQKRAARPKRPPKLLPIHMRARLAEKDLKTKTTEWVGSLLQSAMVAAIFSLVLALVVGHDTGFYSWVPNFLWLAISSTLGAWTVLTAGKYWEANNGDTTMRRFTMAMLGMVVGAASWGLSDVLLFEPGYVLPDIQAFDVDELSPKLHDADGMPRAAGFIVYFGALFGLLRWWKQSDPTRRFRLSLLSTAVTIFGAVFVQALCPVPQAFLLAGATTIAVQMSAPWFTREQRVAMRNEMAEAQLVA